MVLIATGVGAGMDINGLVCQFMLPAAKRLNRLDSGEARLTYGAFEPLTPPDTAAPRLAP